MKVISENNKIIKCWCNNPEKGAIEQAKTLTKLPFVFKYIALMPDTHKGYGMPIGGVMATKNTIVPNAVGVDIGCGMTAVKTNLKQDDINLKEIMGYIRQNIPVGFSHHKEEQVWEGFNKAPDLPVINKELNSAKKQLGTLGGGNHFIEIQKDEQGYIWFMIHSGSRNIGYKIAKHYNKLAQDLCLMWYANIPVFKGEDGLAFLPLNTKEGRDYLQAMTFALDFAFESRKRMIEVCKKAIKQDVKFEDIINIHHNFASLENHFGSNVWVHRKGATSAKEGETGIIPGSQGTSSYIVKGLGNRDSFMSCSHGAGRKLGRKEAQRILDVKCEQKLLDDKGVLHSIRTKEDLDEAPSAYKDIEVVMDEQKDLVKILHKLEPLGVIKG